MRCRRAFIAFQRSVRSSTSSARSSTRAPRSDSSVASIRSSRRIWLFDSPLTSARRREIGAASSRRPSRNASRISSMSRSYRPHRMDSAELDYDLPPELIAQHPAERRDESRLLVYSRATGEVRHAVFRELPELVDALTVVNDTRVVPARIAIEQPKGEVLLLEHLGDGEWDALARPTRKLKPGRRYGEVELVEHLGEGRWRVRLAGEPHGSTPLPPYITAPLDDPDRYQTVYARESGSAAAPTAGLHFTPDVLARLDVERVTLHVGLDTFRPLQAERVEEHRIHGERYEVTAAAWERIRGADAVLAVGTTTVRVL